MARCQSCVENKLRALLRQERERVKELENQLQEHRERFSGITREEYAAEYRMRSAIHHGLERRAKELEKEVATYTQTVRRLLAAENAYGCGFYNYPPWVETYTELAALAGMHLDWAEGKWLEGGNQDGRT